MLLPRSLTKSSPWLLYIGAVAFPFSVALTNLTFAFFILFCLISGQFVQGIRVLWQSQRKLSWAILAYFSIALISLLWSSDQIAGMKVIQHLWMWLMLPCLLAIFLTQVHTRNYFWFSLSLGLALHLLLTVAQMMGWLGNFSPIGGSTPQDATGYIGHIGFGFVYSIWAGWLIHWGYLQQQKRLRLTAWFFATWSLWMIFAAQGRSGYLVAIVILSFLIWNTFIKNRSKTAIFATLTIISCLFCAVLISNWDHPRIQMTIHSIENIIDGKGEKAEARWLLWKAAIAIAKQNPIFGVGTGGYKNAVLALEQGNKEFEGVAYYDHSHQLYLLALMNWGIVGFAIIIWLIFAMFRIQSRREESGYSSDTHQSYKILGKLSALALATHGLSSISLAEHATTLMALFSLALALSIHVHDLTKDSLHKP